MKVIDDIGQMAATSEQLVVAGKRIGLVPTMGYLHDGHLSLVRLARTHSDVVVMSIYVNPTQFGPNEDYAAYPRDFERDARLAKEAGTDIVFHPDNTQMYAGQHQTTVSVGELTQGLCGASRPAHFRGVTTIVAKLFNIVRPHVAVFGQKDAQQAAVIRQMVQDLNFPIEIVIAPIIRDPDGLATSSRNTYLTPQQRKNATVLYYSLCTARDLIDAGEREPAKIIDAMQTMIQAVPETQIDYIEIVDSRTLEPVPRLDRPVLIALAVVVGTTRLIDNMIVTPPF